MSSKIATFAAGCFWGVEEAFLSSGLAGIKSTRVGYTGGHAVNPTYRQVCSGATGHAEATQIFFDPNKTRFSELLAIFWKCHDPTQINRQGPDIGTQYRSAIFYEDAEQKQLAEQDKARLEASGIKIATDIVPATEFYPAEDYHQQYFRKNPGRNYCH